MSGQRPWAWIVVLLLVAGCGDSPEPSTATPDTTDSTRADDVLDEAAWMDPEDTSLSTTPVAAPETAPRVALDAAQQAALQAAYRAMSQGLPEQVHALLGDLLTREPVLSEVQFVAGSAAYELQRYGEAVERLQAAVRDRPEAFLAASSALGFAHHKLGRFDAAREAFEAIVAADPTKHKAHYGLGLVALATGRFDTARPSLEEALRLSPDYLKARFAMARLLEVEGRDAEALEEVRTVVALWPSHDEALYLMAGLLSKLGQADEAESVLVRRAEVYALKEAIADLGSRLLAGEDTPELRLRMVELYEQMGDRREALRLAQVAVRRFPADPPLDASRRRLEANR